MAIDDKYINYNLSLVDPNDLGIPEVPPEPKVNIYVDETAEIELKQEGDEVVPPVEIEQKVEVDITNYGDLDPKTELSLEEEILSTISPDLLSLDTLAMAREFPIVGVDEEFTSKKLVPGTYDNNRFPIPSNLENSMEDFEVTKDNMGKQAPDPEADSEQMDPNFQARVLDQDYEKTKASGQEPSQYNEYQLNSLDSGKDDSVNILDTNTVDLSKIAKVPYTGQELSYDEVVSRLNIKEQSSNLGSIHVYPVNPNDEGGISSKYVIPFEFNAKVTQSGVSAKYDASSLLSRIGDIQSYIKTDTESITITTRYHVLSEEKLLSNQYPEAMKGDRNRTGSWMEGYTLANVQKIEMAYRGLVYPQTSKEVGSFFRPPLIKVVYGNSKKVLDGQSVDGATPFNNLLTYPYRLGAETKIYHKSYIVSKVDIKKDWDMMPLILNDENDGIIDLQGFDVTLQLLEVDPMYIGILPSFEDFYSLVPSQSA